MNKRVSRYPRTISVRRVTNSHTAQLQSVAVFGNANNPVLSFPAPMQPSNAIPTLAEIRALLAE